MSRIRSLVGSRRVLLALVLVASAATTGCSATGLVGPIGCDPMDARSYEERRELASEQEGPMVPVCQPSSR